MHQLTGLSPMIWMTSTILPYGILVQMQVLWNYTWNYQSTPHWNHQTPSFSNTGHRTHQLQRKKYLQNTMNIWMSSKKKWNASLNQEHGTMLLKWNPDLNLKCLNHIPEECEQQELFIKENLKKGYMYSTIKITNGLPFLLCQQERWEIMTNTEL